jgi:cysteine-rich secretory family protein
MLRRIFLVALVCTSALAFAQSDAERGAERTIFTLLNAERAKQGLPALKLDQRLVKLARQHSALLAVHQELSHQFPGEPDLKHRFATTDLRWNFIGENVGEANTPEEVHSGLMHSPPHRENILEPRYNAVGIGAVARGPLIYVTQDFAHRLDELSNAEAEKTVATQFVADRKKHGIQVTQQFDDASLREQACGMATRDNIGMSQLSLPKGTRNVVTFSTGKLNDLPSTVETLAGDPGISKFALGACFARSATYPEGTYWVIMAFQ